MRANPATNTRPGGQGPLISATTLVVMAGT